MNIFATDTIFTYRGKMETMKHGRFQKRGRVEKSSQTRGRVVHVSKLLNKDIAPMGARTPPHHLNSLLAGIGRQKLKAES